MINTHEFTVVGPPARRRSTWPHMRRSSQSAPGFQHPNHHPVSNAPPGLYQPPSDDGAFAPNRTYRFWVCVPAVTLRGFTALLYPIQLQKRKGRPGGRPFLRPTNSARRFSAGHGTTKHIRVVLRIPYYLLSAGLFSQSRAAERGELLAPLHTETRPEGLVSFSEFLCDWCVFDTMSSTWIVPSALSCWTYSWSSRSCDVCTSRKPA